MGDSLSRVSLGKGEMLLPSVFLLLLPWEEGRQHEFLGAEDLLDRHPSPVMQMFMHCWLSSQLGQSWGGGGVQNVNRSREDPLPEFSLSSCSDTLKWYTIETSGPEFPLSGNPNAQP